MRVRDRAAKLKERLLAFLRRLPHKVSPGRLAMTGLAVLVLAQAARMLARDRALAAREELRGLEAAREAASPYLSERAALRDDKARELRKFKQGLSSLARSRRALFEAGIQVAEEKRLLEKQWEIMSAYLLVDEEAGKVHLMRGEQSLESYPVAYAPARAFGGEGKPLTTPAPIVSKERFAHPERGKFEQVGGQVQWEPPQVGTSLRANALGEYVMFARGGLILHGPPRKPAEHEAFPHRCLGLSLKVARQLYRKSFIGTRIVVRRPSGLKP